MGVIRCFTEKKAQFSSEGEGLRQKLSEELGIAGISAIRVLNRYDVEGMDQETYEKAKYVVFAEPQVDEIYDQQYPQTQPPVFTLGVQALPGQFDQRADSCAQCIQLLTGSALPVVETAKLYLFFGTISQSEKDAIEAYLINPVECCKASDSLPQTLSKEIPQVAPPITLDGFIHAQKDALSNYLADYALAMDLDDLTFLQTYFRNTEKRDPTITELRVVDTYWSDHCRHTTFSTHITSAEVIDRQTKLAYDAYLAAREEVYGAEKAALRPKTLMDIATIGAKTLKKRGMLTQLDESEEINACSIRVTAKVNGKDQPWLLMFKNETHNHPTEIEPFGGAATCIGGCIRDPLSGRAYVYQAMRLSGGGDPTVPFSSTLEGKLPQRKIAQTAAAGYSSYGNQIGLATGQVSEIYHNGYIAKHLECGAVVGAAPAENVVRLAPSPGDVVILLGGRTGRDGIGGATGSSKSHTDASLSTMAAQVQKGNAPEERKIQRLFRDGAVSKLIKRCNDFGAGGVCVAIGELADGLEINLDAVRKKYDGLDATEIAISESQERMAVVLAPQNAEAFIAAAEKENLEAYVVATVTQSPRMVMRWQGQTVADLSREFLNTNGATKTIAVTAQAPAGDAFVAEDENKSLKDLASNLKYTSRRGLSVRFDSSVGAATVLSPFGGKYQRTAPQIMAAMLPALPGDEIDTCSAMAWGFDPDAMSRNPFQGAYEAVVNSVSKLVAAGCAHENVYLSFQEFFEKLGTDPVRWGKPFSALLGALQAQLDLSLAAIGGKDSMSGSFENLDVPPSLISFAVTAEKAEHILSPEFKAAGKPVYLFAPTAERDYLPMWRAFCALTREKKVQAAWAVSSGGIAEGIMNMAFGNGIGFVSQATQIPWHRYLSGAIVAQCDAEILSPFAQKLGETTQDGFITLEGDRQEIAALLSLNEAVLEPVYPTRAAAAGECKPISYPTRAPLVASEKIATPRAVIPVFPGTNSEYDTANACLRAGITPEIVVLKNLSAAHLEQSSIELSRAIEKSQMVILPGGFSGGDEPDGSAKFICSFLRGQRVQDSIHHLLKNRDGLILGICNGFQALIKLGLVPFGEIRDLDDTCPTLTHNVIGRHQTGYVQTRIASVNSPWMLCSQVGDTHAIPISHGEGRFVASEQMIKTLIENGQVATQYVDFTGMPTMDIQFNPNGSAMAIEGIFSPDGRVFGKMAHSERANPFVAKNIPFEKMQPIFQSGAKYYE